MEVSTRGRWLKDRWPQVPHDLVNGLVGGQHSCLLYAPRAVLAMARVHEVDDHGEQGPTEARDGESEPIACARAVVRRERGR